MAGRDKGVTDLTFALRGTRSATGLCARGSTVWSRRWSRGSSRLFRFALRWVCARAFALLETTGQSRYGPLTLGRPPEAAWAADRGDAVPDPGGNGLDAEAQLTG
jgi:hypothetical protein